MTKVRRVPLGTLVADAGPIRVPREGRKSETLMGRILAIGDIHGCLTALQTLDQSLVFGRDDVVIALGDYVNRGPDSKGAIDYLIELKTRTKLIALRGNHEVMLLSGRTAHDDYFESWLEVGGRETMASYQAESLDQIPDRHWQFIETTLLWYETDTHFFVHGNVGRDLPLPEQTEDILCWDKFLGRRQPPHCSGKTMVCGHTAQHSGKPFDVGHAVCIDTWVYGKGWLTCLEVASGHYWQANQAGDLRDDQLSRA
ncbi:MAG: serine/threonine protein phosphatase 1 [Chthoniobacter sp.]|jgi:serine/threonine protein phosphatase 1|nr:serine/threonine protein phosphatase 1 [Chthoniobacter sp.]